MADFVNLNQLRIFILESIDQLLEIRKSAETYAVDPSEDNETKLLAAVDSYENRREGLELHLTHVIKQANGVEDEVMGTQTENGIILE